MSTKVFIQIVVLIIIFAFVSTAVECLHKNLCKSYCKAKLACTMNTGAIK